ncbi:hypothetical protein [Gimesia fumaroli]|jgi:hypothetical protein|uniref:Uncharacterized protein n=1 Tax=Gimesia fumaroli TaxID=2527976 RepID=A0A518IF97_9PLAN|nr:hypothetical protein [Gimesia fumaroli]QDV51757.1 hypothetical protein Enr17x_38150 [Gimesia fumaroli]
MFAAKDVSSIFITMHVEEAQVLFILLAADGAVNRMGTGAEDNDEKQLFIAQSSPDMFEALKSKIQPETSQWEGGYADPEPNGKTCQLTVGFMNSDGEESACKFQYGSESQGPPPDLCNLVMAAIEITDPWYEEQKQITSKE